jgi:WD40 repeat protein
MITVDRGPETREKPDATKIRTYDISKNANFAVTLHLKEMGTHANSSTETTKATTITIDPPIPPTRASAVLSVSNASLTKICAVISVWDLRSENDKDRNVGSLPSQKTLEYLKPCAEFDFLLPEGLNVLCAWDNFRASISISAQGTKVALCGIEKTYGSLPFTVFDCKRGGEIDTIGANRTIQVETRPPCKELKEFSGYGVFHRIDPNAFDISDDSDNERFVVFNGMVIEIYSTRDSGWKLLQKLTLSPNRGLHRANCYAMVQSLRGRYFAWTGNPGVVSIWDMEKGKPVSSISVDTDKGPIYAVLSPDGSKVAISVRKTVQIYESPTGILLGTHTTGVMSDNNSEVVLGNEYFVMKDNSHTSECEPTRVRSVVRIKDMKVVESKVTYLHEDYHILYPLASSTTIAVYKQVCEQPHLSEP